ncbi:MAG: HesA/MoeB/ThiF family protein [Oscillospiraceae bacterium]|nr:HesA/MoeB/ThiF family protein [Christensenellales bacterium]HIR68857.1 HesA/MoeB/ThiF family protein [Candidatus Pelethousia gallinarum]
MKGELDMQERYIRNLGPLTEEECLLLRQRRVFLAGCGGLGGYLLEHLLRAGVGAITVCDGDTIVPSNLNRQLLADMESLGRSKTEAACARAALVNPEAAVEARPVFLTADNALGLIAGHDLALDALDSPAARRILASACRQAGIPLVHGAIRGWYAQAAVILPDSGMMEQLYPADAPAAPDQGSLSPTVGLCAAIQAGEAVKLLCGRPSPLAGRLLWVDLVEQEYQVVSFCPEGPPR